MTLLNDVIIFFNIQNIIKGWQLNKKVIQVLSLIFFNFPNGEIINSEKKILLLENLKISSSNLSMYLNLLCRKNLLKKEGTAFTLSISEIVSNQGIAIALQFDYIKN